MNEIPISSKGSKGGNALFSVQILRRNLEIWRVPRQPTRKVGWTDKTSYGCVFCAKHSILKGCKFFHKGALKRGGENMHFVASDTSNKMMLDLISFATVTCILDGISGSYWKEKQGRSWTPTTRPPLFLLEESRRLPVCLELLQLTFNQKICLDCTGEPVSKSINCWERLVWLIQNEETTEAVVERGNVTKKTRNSCDAEILAQQDWERPQAISVPYWILKKRRFNKIRKTCVRRFWNEQNKPYLHLKNHHDVWFVIDLEAEQNSMVFFHGTRGSVSCNDTVPAEIFTTIINMKDGSERFEKAQSKEGEASPTKKGRRDRNTPRKTSGHESQDQETLESRPLGELLSTEEVFERKTTTARSTFNANWCTKNKQNRHHSPQMW